MNKINISFLEHSDVLKAAELLSYAMLNNPLHVAIFQGKGERERLEIEKMFIELFTNLPLVDSIP